MALKSRAIPSPVPETTGGPAKRGVSVKASLDEMLSAYRQRTAMIKEEMLTAHKELVTLVLRARDEEELAASYIKVFRVARDMDDVITAGGKPIKEVCEEFKLGKIPEAFEAAKISTMTLDTGDRVSLSERVLANIKGGMKEAALKFLKSNKKTKALVTETVNASTLSVYAGSLMEQNLSLPEDLFNVTVQTQASLTRGKK